MGKIKDIFDEIFNAPTFDQVTKYGTMVEFKTTKNKSNNVWCETYIYKYKDKKYIIEFKCTSYPKPERSRIKFTEYVEEV